MSGHIIQGRSSDEIATDVARAEADQGHRRSKRDPTAPGRITAIKQQVKRANRYSIYIDGAYAFSLSESALLDEKIYVGQEVTPEQRRAYQDTSAFDKAYGLTLAYVARRLRSEWELRDYFRRKQVDEESAERILERLRNFGYVDDFKFASSWVDNRRAIKPVSRRRLQQELRQKRIADDVIVKVLEGDDTSDQETLRQLVAKKRQHSRYQDDTKLMQYLARQGYNYDDIKLVMTAADDDSYVE